MSRRTTPRARLAIATASALSLTAAAMAGATNTSVVAAPASADNGVRGLGLGEPTFAQFAASHQNRRALPVANQIEKLNGGGESVSGPAQEEYDNRAYPATSIAPAQAQAARTAFAKHGRGSKGFTQVGPDGNSVPGAVTYTGKPSNVSGRTAALLPLGPCSTKHCTVLIGTAGGGIWRTTNAMAKSPDWTPVGSGLTSGAIGSLTLAGGVVYAGTGEPNGSSDNEAGTGLFKSTDRGTSFTRVLTYDAHGDFAVGRSISSIVVDRANAQHMLVGTMVARHGSSSVNGGRFTPPGAAQIGVYETSDAGAHWTLSQSHPSDSVDPTTPSGLDFFRGGVTRIEQDPVKTSVFYASFSDYGLDRLSGKAWKSVFTSAGTGSAANSIAARTEFDAVKLPNGNTRIYLGDATSGPGGKAGLFRTDNAVASKPVFTLLSSPAKTDPGYSSYNYCGGQCSYDMPVASPDSNPDVVYIGGQMMYAEIFTAHQPSNGRAVQRSTDAGKSFTDMTNDTTGNGLHPDQHAMAFAGDAVLLASDGGVNRIRGGFVDRSKDCDARGLTPTDLSLCHGWLSSVPVTNTAINAGLQTLQFQSASVSPNGRELLAGAQDNGTWTLGAQGQRSFESVGGDGGQSGFDAANSDIRYHSYYAPQHDVNFKGSDPYGWTWISDALLASGEAASFYTPLTADPVVGGTVFDGLQHLWRSTDNGAADKAALQKHCNEFTGDFDAAYTCGDFVPLGGPQGGNTAGDLTGSAYGTDKAGGYVVAIQRSSTDRGTMWVATRRGRVFVTHNADAANPLKVTFTRIDSSATPTRFVSGIAIDPRDANHAVLSYSGYDAYARTAGQATGHLFDVRRKGAKGTFVDVTGDLGDQPLTSVVVDWASGTNYVGTDFGVLARAAANAPWGTVQGLPVVAVYGLTYDPAHRKVIAATHGRGIWAAKI